MKEGLHQTQDRSDVIEFCGEVLPLISERYTNKQDRDRERGGGQESGMRKGITPGRM